MVQITNPKVASLEPRWAPFPGFSLLFDNPGDSFTPVDGLLLSSCRVETDPELGFYRRLVDRLRQIDHGGPPGDCAFCPLPPASYHVTVWDGCNAGNIGQVAKPARGALAAYLQSLPRALTQEAEFESLLAVSPLLSDRAWDLRFRFQELEIWSDVVLVARLAPADPEAEDQLSRLVEERQRLTARFRDKYGIGPSDRYVPHVSLGYFANQELARRVHARVAGWNEAVAAGMKGLTLEFRSISLHGFPEMAHFYKRAQRD